MSGPHTAQLDRDHLDDHDLVDRYPAGDEETAPEPRVRQHPAGTVPNTTTHHSKEF
ncbi:hypothetical protein [Mycolicibacterium insubricum]|uniref:hypothetical protein n=1 Tax=Mycolicibacterium insubricum TaxID=444597 RepID=UPI0013D66C74|nr:hypothetical protein [Mycolicibacterium insubricum]MCV7082893.1 hypothetical protein [Mycolicibacterium insubricum]